MTTATKSGQQLVKEACIQKGVSLKEVDEILSIIGSELTEEEIEEKFEEYPQEAVDLASGLFFGII